MGWFTVVQRILSSILLSFSSYEYGKNSELETQIINHNLVEKLQMIEANKKIIETADSGTNYTVWVVVGISIAVAALILKEIYKCRRLQRNTNNNQNNNGVHVNL